MDLEKNKPGLGSKPSAVADQTHRLLHETQKLGNQIYEEGKHKVDELQENIKESSDKLIEQIREKPMQSLLIAAGIGFLLSHLLQKK